MIDASKDYEDVHFETLRAKIDACDEQIVDLLVQRFKLVREMGIYKTNHNLPVIDTRREGELLSRRKEQASGVRSELVEGIFESILDESRRIQDELRESFNESKFDC